MWLQDFYDYKNRFMKDLLTTPEIVKLIDPALEDMSDAKKLAYTQIMPSEFYPETIEDGKVYLCFDVDVTKVYSSTLYSLNLNIWIFVHKSLMRLPEGGVRSDKLCSEIDKKINGSLFYGLGKLDLVSAKRFAPMSDYCGKVLVYQADEFNRPFQPLKNVPSNRKVGK